MYKTLSIPEWHRLTKEGTKLPVRITLRGWSMEPLIRMNTDYVTVMPLDTLPQIGDIVLFADQNGTRYVIHRVWDMNNQNVLTWGDNCLAPDGWIPIEEVLGKIVLIERGKRKIQTNPVKGVKWARFWHQAGKVYRPYIKYKYALKNRIEKQD